MERRGKYNVDIDTDLKMIEKANEIKKELDTFLDYISPDGHDKSIDHLTRKLMSVEDLIKDMHDLIAGLER